ncbi:extracellular solute-binding protein [Thermoanaerobacterium sp. RBIITD]|uniref:ABC transporter substrate-binding protein n=1 Tax=Thermoanaerobacterium sp. RBIITD TaxID=1550240 RepID=UPI000BB863AD|nr:extracellular solute-binding protein [Thermoanaerobacterium sp. RBIITD]SNX53318.1 multiple sugar transport system substrate-binding protein [Thermoanaerobacterium sp. RBIITD]
MKLKKILAILLAMAMIASILAGCSKTSENSQGGTTSTKKDIVKVWTFPVEKDYVQNFEKIKADFESKNPNIEIQREDLSWAEGVTKFDTAINAGDPPDLMFVVPSAKYVQTGLAVPIDKYIDKKALSDYYPTGLEYMKVGGKLYGLPLYMKIHTIAGNKKLLEEAGIDWKKIQENGWTWDEFKEAAKKGTKINADGKKQYGFVFHGAGTDITELLDHMNANNGLPYIMDKNGKFMYTDPKFLETLKFIKSMIDEGIMPKESNQITPQKRMEYFYTEQAMIIGKAMPYYEVVIGDNNKKVQDKTAPAGQKEVDFVLLPEPHAQGQKAVTIGGVDGYSMYKQKNYSGPVSQEQHLKNVAKVLVALTSGEAGVSAKVLCLPQVTKSGDAMWKDKYTMKPENKAEVDRLFKNVLPPVQIDPAKAQKAQKLYDQVIKAEYPALLGGDITPDKMYQDVKNAAQEMLGE